MRKRPVLCLPTKSWPKVLQYCLATLEPCRKFWKTYRVGGGQSMNRTSKCPAVLSLLSEVSVSEVFFFLAIRFGFLSAVNLKALTQSWMRRSFAISCRMQVCNTANTNNKPVYTDLYHLIPVNKYKLIETRKTPKDQFWAFQNVYYSDVQPPALENLHMLQGLAWSWTKLLTVERQRYPVSWSKTLLSSPVSSKTLEHF